jgi:predicted Rossmann-fold nucleotide-binding protein
MIQAIRRLPVVGVMGSGAASIDPALERRAAAVGELVAQLGCHLLTGGGAGVMSAAARGFVAVEHRPGLSIGILPAQPPQNTHDGTGPVEPPPGYPNPWIELAIQTHLPRDAERGADPQSRNHVNVLSSDALVVLHGAAGTASEVVLAQRYDRPHLAFLDDPERELGLRPPGTPVARSLEEVEKFLRGIIERSISR